MGGEVGDVGEQDRGGVELVGDHLLGLLEPVGDLIGKDVAEQALGLREQLTLDRPGNRKAVEFFAALPGAKTVTDCTTAEGLRGLTVTCDTDYNVHSCR